jgi:hypothetical protein
MNFALAGTILTTVALLSGSLLQQLMARPPAVSETGLQTPQQLRLLEKNMRGQWSAMPDNAALLIRLSNLYRDTGNLDQASNCAKIALHVLTSRNDRDKHQLAVAYNNLAVLEYLQATSKADDSQARVLINEALEQIWLAQKYVIQTERDFALENAVNTNQRLIELAQNYFKAR